MTKQDKITLIKTSWELHSQVEESYLAHPASSNDPEWLDKQRYLLADMALHLLQTSMKPEPIDLSRLRDNLHAILTVSDRFIPEADLKKAGEKLYDK